MSEDNGQSHKPDDESGSSPAEPPQPQFNPQTGFPAGEQPPTPPSYPTPGSQNPYGGTPTPQWQPYPPGQPGQPGWAPQPGMPGYPVYALPDHPRATAALVVGLIAVAGGFTCLLPILASPVAWVLGAKARREIRSAPQQWGGESRATAGMVLGIIGTVLLVLGLLLVLVILIVALNDPAAFDSDTNV